MTNSLPSWIERLLGVRTGSGEGVAWSLDHRWAWPAWITLLVAVLAIGIVVATYLRENRRARPWLRTLLAATRLALLAVAAFMLAQVTLSLKRTGLPYLAVLVDDSLSMTIADRYSEPVRQQLEDRVRKAGFDRLTRWNLARTLLTEDDAALLASLEQDYKLRVYYLSGLRVASALGSGGLAAELRRTEPWGPNTRLGAAIRQILDELRGNAPAALVVLTDGINTEGPGLAEAADYARRRSVPLYFVGLGDDQPVRDVKLTDLLVDDVVFVHEVVYFEAKLSATGYQGRTAQVVLRRKGQKEPLAKTEVTLGPDGRSQQVRLAYRPAEEGEFRYVVEVEPLEGELQTENNRQEKTVRVRKEKIRVLLVEADPRYEYRYLRNMLARDPTIELKAVLQNADPEHADQDSAVLRGFPVRRDELFRYDVVILGDADPGLMSPAMLKNLADFVDQPGKGGALVCIAGPRYMPTAYRNTPLAKLLPIDAATVRNPPQDRPLAEGFRVQPTDLGLASPMLQLADAPGENAAVWRQLPPLYWLLEAPDVKPGARVLADCPSRRGPDGRPWPVIVMHYVGAGRVLFHATDETWRWRFRVGDLYFARYWVQTIRYLARSKLAEGDRTATLTTDRREYRLGEPVQLRLRFHDERLAPAEDDGVLIVVEHAGGKTQRLKLERSRGGRGVFEGSLDSPPLGSYHAWVAAPQLAGPAPAADFTVLAPPGEFARVEMDAREIQRAAEQSRGRSYTMATAERLLSDLPEGRQVPIESLPPRPLWNTWPVLLAFLTLLVAEWVLRKLGGMA
jgi:hypothetical protein